MTSKKQKKDGRKNLPKASSVDHGPGPVLTAWTIASHEESDDPVQFRNHLTQLSQSFQRMGFAREALTGFLKLESLATLDEDRLFARLERIRTLRMMGLVDEAISILSGTNPGNCDDELGLELAWEKICLDLLQTQDASAMIKAVGRGKRHRHSTYQLEAKLWLYTLPERHWIDRISKADSIRRLYGSSIRSNKAEQYLFDVTNTLDRCYDKDVPVSKKTEELGNMLSTVHEIGSADRVLLVWAAAARWLTRYHQFGQTAIALEEYRQWCLRLSEGSSPDVLGFISDITARTWYRMDQNQSLKSLNSYQSLSTLRTSKFSRFLNISRLAMSVSAVKVKSELRKVGKDPRSTAALIHEEHAEIARALLKHLGTFKGPLVKVGQVLSFLAPSLPVPIKEALDSLRETSVPFDHKIIRTVIERELGESVDTLFAHWSETPLAAASIGQIHEARTHSGDRVIVKVQYPDIDKAVQNDFAIIRLLGPYFRRLFPAADIDMIMAESERTLLEELDYKREATLQESLRNLVGEHHQWYIPRVHADLSTDKVLTMEYVDGLNFYDFCQQSSQDEKNAAAQKIYEFSWKCLFEYHIFNGDPHPGNYKFLPDGRVCFLDFGYAQTYDPDRACIWAKMVEHVMDGNPKGFVDGFKELGYVVFTDRFNEDVAWKNAWQMTEAIRSTEPFRFTHEYVSQVINGLTLDNANRQTLTLPREDSRIVRFYWCLIAVMADLNAETVWRDSFLRAVNRAG